MRRNCAGLMVRGLCSGLASLYIPLPTSQAWTVRWCSAAHMGVGVGQPNEGQPNAGQAVTALGRGGRPVCAMVEISTTTETVIRKHLLRPETHLREGQGAEWAAQVAATQASSADRTMPAASRSTLQGLAARLNSCSHVPAAGEAVAVPQDAVV